MKYVVIILIAAGLGIIGTIGWLEYAHSEKSIREACDNIGANERKTGQVMGMPEQAARVFGEHARLKCLSREGLKG